MKTKPRNIIFAISLIITLQAPAQDTLNYKTIFPSGIFLGYGQGLYSVKDVSISKEKSSQKRKCVNNQNNSASYFRLLNTELHHHKNKNNQLRKDL